MSFTLFYSLHSDSQDEEAACFVTISNWCDFISRLNKLAIVISHFFKCIDIKILISILKHYAQLKSSLKKLVDIKILLNQKTFR